MITTNVSRDGNHTSMCIRNNSKLLLFIRLFFFFYRWGIEFPSIIISSLYIWSSLNLFLVNFQNYYLVRFWKDRPITTLISDCMFPKTYGNHSLLLYLQRDTCNVWWWKMSGIISWWIACFVTLRIHVHRNIHEKSVDWKYVAAVLKIEMFEVIGFPF